MASAGAIDFLGRYSGLPPALSGHLGRGFFWGPALVPPGDCAIVLDDRKEVLEGYWRQVKYVGTSADSPYAWEKGISVFICKGATFGNLAQIWARVEALAVKDLWNDAPQAAETRRAVSVKSPSV